MGDVSLVHFCVDLAPQSCHRKCCIASSFLLLSLQAGPEPDRHREGRLPEGVPRSSSQLARAPAGAATAAYPAACTQRWGCRPGVCCPADCASAIGSACRHVGCGASAKDIPLLVVADGCPVLLCRMACIPATRPLRRAAQPSLWRCAANATAAICWGTSPLWRAACCHGCVAAAMLTTGLRGASMCDLKRCL